MGFAKAFVYSGRMAFADKQIRSTAIDVHTMYTYIYTHTMYIYIHCIYSIHIYIQCLYKYTHIMSIYIYTYNKVSALWGTPLAINPTGSCLAIRPGADHTGVSAWLCGFWLGFFCINLAVVRSTHVVQVFHKAQVIHFCAECLACPLCQ